MSREIKFRAWDKQWGKMLLPEEWRMPRIQLDGSLYDDFGDPLDGNDYILEQCTGLKDRNGKEIYEGDIVKMMMWDTHLEKMVFIHTTEIIWNARYARFDTRCGDTLSDELAVDCFEVIGNIHENPELLYQKNHKTIDKAKAI